MSDEDIFDPEKIDNNQCFPFYPDSPIYAWNGLRFRSKSEIRIAQVLDDLSGIYIPNCIVRVYSTPMDCDTCTPQRMVNMEVDFLIWDWGYWGILEVDGPHHTRKRRCKEQERERLFKHKGIMVYERFDAKSCYKDPHGVLEEFFKIMSKMYYPNFKLSSIKF